MGPVVAVRLQTIITARMRNDVHFDLVVHPFYDGDLDQKCRTSKRPAVVAVELHADEHRGAIPETVRCGGNSL